MRTYNGSRLPRTVTSAGRVLPDNARPTVRILWILLLVAVVLGIFDTAVFLHWSPSLDSQVTDYLKDFPNLDNVIRYRRQYEPVYPLGVATLSAFTGLSFLGSINVSRLVLEILILLFVGLIVFELTQRLSFGVFAMLMVNFSTGFWSLSINLLRNLHGAMLTLAFIWVLLRLFRRPPRPWLYRIIAGVLLAAILETHIVMAIVISGVLLLFFLAWLVLFLLSRQSDDSKILKDLIFVGLFALFLSLPYDYVRFYLQQFYRTHEFIVPASQAKP